MAAEFDVDRRFIAAGCLILDDLSETSLLASLSCPQPTTWRHFLGGDDGSNPQTHEDLSISSGGVLDKETQVSLLASDVLSPFAALFVAGWIHLAVGLSCLDPRTPKAIVRVYLLPDDTAGWIHLAVGYVDPRTLKWLRRWPRRWASRTTMLSTSSRKRWSSHQGSSNREPKDDLP